MGGGGGSRKGVNIKLDECERREAGKRRRKEEWVKEGRKRTEKNRK